MIKAIGAIFLAGSLLTSSVWAADQTPLPPGKPSGVKQAQVDRQTVFLIGGGILAVTGFALLIAAAQHESTSPLTIAGGNNALDSGLGTTSTTTSSATTT